LHARVSAGTDPSTGERIVLYETVPSRDARTKAARERAERERLQGGGEGPHAAPGRSEADALEVGRTKATVMERWMAQHEIDATTRMNYACPGSVRRHRDHVASS
jgi:hypothetical protein